MSGTRVFWYICTECECVVPTNEVELCPRCHGKLNKLEVKYNSGLKTKPQPLYVIMLL